MVRTILVLIACFVSCLSVKGQNVVVEKLAVERFGGPAEIFPNRDQSFNLATRHVENPENNLPVVKYLVVRAYDQKIVEEGAVTMGSIAWSGDYELEIKHAPGQVRLQRDSNSVVRKIDLRIHLKGLAPK